MLEILKYLKARYMSEKAQGMVEYALVLALVVAVGIAVFGAGADGQLGQAITKAFGKVTDQINNIGGSGTAAK